MNREKIFSVDIKHTETGIHFKCKEEDLEDCVQEYIRNNTNDIDWTYEEVSK